MFRDEADLAARLIHPNVCRVFTLGHHDATWYIAMEYLHGVPLSRMLSILAKRKALVDFRIIAGIIIQACDGLHHAHEARDDAGNLLGVVHRDVSPPNIMLVDGGTVKMLDFGIAKARGANSRTRTGTVKGKNAYMSPEQILGKPLDRRSDVFALGAVMFELLAVKRLFHRESDFLTFKAITEDALPEIRDRRPDIPPGLRAALTQALARDPSGRFATTRGFAEAVRIGVSGLGGPATAEELSAFLRREFAEEVAARDELLVAADAPAPAPTPGMRNTGSAAALAATPAMFPAARADGPRLSAPASTAGIVELEAIGGELESSGRHDRPPPPAPLDAVPTMIVAPGSGAISARRAATADPVAASSSMAPAHASSSGMHAPTRASTDVGFGSAGPGFTLSPDGPTTDILRSYRRKNLRNWAIGLALIAAVIVVVVLVARRGGPSATAPSADGSATTAAAGAVDARGAADARPPDADTRADIIAASKYGWFSVDADAPTEIFVDKVSIGTTPITKWPLRPGARKVVAKGPKGKVQKFDVTVYAAQEVTLPMIGW
jgi:hypothetical protein